MFLRFYYRFLSISSIAVPMMTKMTIMAMPVPKTYVSVIDAAGAVVGANVGCGCSTANVVSVVDGQ